jgi:5-methylcytosine-specific restriction endonuclease McrA
MPRKFVFTINSSRKFSPKRPRWHVTARKWRRLRHSWLMQYPTCARCGLVGEEVHHIVPRSEAPERTLDATNLETLCRGCHRLHHAPTPGR